MLSYTITYTKDMKILLDNHNALAIYSSQECVQAHKKQVEFNDTAISPVNLKRLKFENAENFQNINMVIRILRVDESNTALEIAWTAHKLFLKSGALNKG